MSEAYADQRARALQAIRHLRPYRCADIFVGDTDVPIYAYNHARLLKCSKDIAIFTLDALLAAAGFEFKGESKSHLFLQRVHLNAQSALVLRRDPDGDSVDTLYLPKRPHMISQLRVLSQERRPA